MHACQYAMNQMMQDGMPTRKSNVFQKKNKYGVNRKK